MTEKCNSKETEERCSLRVGRRGVGREERRMMLGWQSLRASTSAPAWVLLSLLLLARKLAGSSPVWRLFLLGGSAGSASAGSDRQA